MKSKIPVEFKGDTQYISLYLSPCDQKLLDSKYPGSVCQNETEKVKYAVSNSYLRVIFTNRYFDVEDFSDNPVKTTTESYSFYINRSTMRLQTFAMNRNKAIGSNSIIHESLGQFQYEFIQTDVKSLTNIERSDSNDYMVVRFMIENNLNIVERQINNFLQLLSSTGGLLGLLTTLVRSLIEPFQEFSFAQSIIKTRYLIDKNLDQNLKKKSGDKIQLMLNEAKVNSYLEMIKTLKSRIPFIYSTKEALQRIL
ncbi:UNKNOWN [Stylonychia lemnae]|uniref:Uncharacterized protein n=1 Tax=Stylonychia lemnae TaxID=5949 RepID=A0A078AB92_STYLE|nr:UNKNOWN [Stylonychia lemnae]|eukprot:CDW78048.1 UNKNOWN [Stylonychia lemnae]